ncbi:glycosyltransferase family 2 protein [Polynucleobacter sp. Tro8-14-1]|uniref:glycosyltransferase family 2 protein n=1 Tax=Polynucleobacter sp. Tro8-14-1 TaxID=1758383 RepID=UPI001C0BF8D1|nr:hypothetical protein [Polynucleobacter sp. Tro8-14-1]MBU3563611.1 glycosyltransferase family 2 protein [Polynucleobacter sp. Tro8-14-1]
MNPVLKKFGVVVVLHGKGANDVLQNYPAIFEKLDALSIPVVLVDHGAHSFGEKDFVRNNIEYISQENKGFGSGVNQGCRALFKSCQYAIVLNPDLHFAVEELLDIGSGLSNSFGVIETQEHGIKRGIRFYNQFTGVVSDNPSRYTVPYFNGAAFCVSKELFEKTGGFDEKFFLYFEDLDYSMQLKSLSIPLAIIQSNSFVHKVGGTREHGKSLEIERAASLSGLRFVYKWLTWNIWLYVRYCLKWILANHRI